MNAKRQSFSKHQNNQQPTCHLAEVDLAVYANTNFGQPQENYYACPRHGMTALPAIEHESTIIAIWGSLRFFFLFLFFNKYIYFLFFIFVFLYLIRTTWGLKAACQLRFISDQIKKKKKRISSLKCYFPIPGLVVFLFTRGANRNLIGSGRAPLLSIGMSVRYLRLVQEQFVEKTGSGNQFQSEIERRRTWGEMTG